MRTMMIAVVLLAVAACTAQKSAPADSTGAVATAPADSAVTQKLAPDTLVRGDGKRCTVESVKYSVVEIGKPFICDWR